MAKRDIVGGAGSAPQRLHWERDGNLGPDDPNSSMRILLDWITTEGNYSRFCGKNGVGMRKVEFANQIAVLINAQQVRIARTAKDVMNKIQYLESQFREASDWMNNTGAGVTDQEQFDAYVKKLCPYYDDLKAVMDDRNGTRPLDTIGNFDEEEDENNNNNNDNNDIEDEDIDESNGSNGNSRGDEDSSSNEGDRADGTIGKTGTLEEGRDRPPEIVVATPPPRKKRSRGAKSVASLSVTSRSRMGGSVWSGPKKKKEANAQFLSKLMDNQGDLVQETAKHNRQADDETARHNRMMEQVEMNKLKASDETARHNRMVEEIEAGKLRMSQDTLRMEQDKMRMDHEEKKWNAKAKEFEYKMILYEKFKAMKNEMPREALLAAFPDMAIFFRQEDAN
jgi:hypothetical protein